MEKIDHNSQKFKSKIDGKNTDQVKKEQKYIYQLGKNRPKYKDDENRNFQKM